MKLEEIFSIIHYHAFVRCAGTCILSAGERSCTWKFDAEAGNRCEIVYSTSSAFATIEVTDSGLVLTFEGVTYKKAG